uniref:Uncharacterized protein n=1 Tax=Romanomermis culicivorax TaxID=13658 RepID=A0A915IFR9_ROMCU
MKAQKKELSKPNAPKIENIVRPMSSYAQSLKLSKPKNTVSNQRSQLSFQGIIDDDDDDLIIPTQWFDCSNALNSQINFPSIPPSQ